MPEKESAADRAIREALESVERIERESKPKKPAPAPAPVPVGISATDDDAEQVEILGAEDSPPSGDASAPTAPPASTPTPAPTHAQPKKSPSDFLLEATLKAKQEMQEVLGQTQKEAKDLFDRLARVSADFDNFKKRVTREKADAIKFANEAVFKEMLPVLDNMLRAMAAGEANEGVRLVAKQFEDVLAKMGAVGFKSQGEPFDPARHEAVGGRADDTVPAQHVVEEYQRGYMLHDRLLRPALVIVSSGPAN